MHLLPPHTSFRRVPSCVCCPRPRLFSHLFHSREGSDASNQLPLSTLQAALRVNGTEMSLDELECILANLIFQQNMKGYIAHKRCVVLSKVDPFPKVN